MARTLRFVTLALSGIVLTGYAAQTQSPSRPWPPAVQPVAPIARPLPPAEALKSFAVPPGYRIELVAAEPLVQDPIMLEWDPAGRLWVIELPGYMRDISAQGELDPVGRIVVLQDRDRDGVMDTRTVFADGLVQPRGVKVLDHGVLVGESPDIWLMRDTDGDLRSDTKTRVAGNYGRRLANVEINANSFYWALDNRIYSAGLAADQFLTLRGGAFEVRESVSRGQWGLTQDDAGRIYRNNNESPLHVDLVPAPYYARNPNLVRTRGSHERMADPAGSLATVWPSHQTPGTNRAYQFGILRENGTLARYTAACAPTIYRGDRFPADVYGNAFVAEPAANLVSRMVLWDDGKTLRGKKAWPEGEFLTSTDERFRPVHLSNAPDGTLYIADMYRGILQHGAYVTEYLRQQIQARELEKPTGYGRIYRVVHESARPAAALPDTSSAERLVALLGHPNGWWRETAQRLLVERGERGTAAKLASLARTAPDWRTRVHALWTLDGLDAVTPDIVTRALEDASRDVRVSAIRVAERWLGQAGHPIQAAVRKLAGDADWAVRQQYAASIGALPAGERPAAAAALLGRHGDDPVLTDAALSGLAGQEAAVISLLLKEAPAAASGPAGAALTLLAGAVARGADEAAMQELLASIARPGIAPWQRAALLGGAEIALLGTAVPDAGVERPAPPSGAPCPTCPGGRGGPGGAYAFPAAQAASAAAQRMPQRERRTSITLARAPEAFARLAGQPDEAGTRAAALLARLSWPGQAAGAQTAAAAPAPLMPEEQRRFEAGREIYGNMCVACHGPDGQGVGAIGAPLVTSPIVPAAAGLPIRVLLHGKEGEVGLMPPVGTTLADEQIAAVLTYIRREWNGTASPVDAAAVAAVRTATAGRTKPWTKEELMALPESAR